MNITFNTVSPAPLHGLTDLNTQIWNKNLVFNQGVKYKIHAPSGKGKSTFMHLIYGLRTDFEGDILIDTKSVRKNSLNQWADLRTNHLAIVFQDLRLFPELTGFENIAVKTSLYENPVSKSEIERMVDTLQISHIMNKKGATMSYGERQRVAIIRTLSQPFSWLLLDEPFSHLDEENASRACELINQSCELNKAGILFTSLGADYAMNFDEKIQL
jgi:ABC-type lipoprotein export system ATPase subunit